MHSMQPAPFQTDLRMLIENFACSAVCDFMGYNRLDKVIAKIGKSYRLKTIANFHNWPGAKPLPQESN
jgi:hypothetical protein